MTDYAALVVRLQETDNGESVSLGGLLDEAAAAIEEITEERKDWARRFLLNDVTPMEWMTRALAAETEADCESEMTDEWRKRAERAEAERDALRQLLRAVQRELEAGRGVSEETAHAIDMAMQK